MTPEELQQQLLLAQAAQDREALLGAGEDALKVAAVPGVLLSNGLTGVTNGLTGLNNLGRRFTNMFRDDQAAPSPYMPYESFSGSGGSTSAPPQTPPQGFRGPPNSASVVPAGIDWTAQRGGAVRSAGARGAVPESVSNISLTADQLSKLADRMQSNEDANRQANLQAVRGMTAPTSLNRVQAAADLEAKSPMPQDASYYRRLAANLPFWSDKLNGMDFSGARDHAMAVDKEERGALGEAMKMRQAGIDRKMGYMAGDNTDQNAITTFLNKQKGLEAAAGQLSSDALKFRGQGLENMAQRQTQMDIAKLHESGANSRADRTNQNQYTKLIDDLRGAVAQGMPQEQASAIFKAKTQGAQKEPAALSSTEATWIDATAQSLLGKNMNTPQGQNLYLKFRMAASIPGMQNAAQKALYDDIHSTKW